MLAHCEVSGPCGSFATLYQITLTDYTARDISDRKSGDSIFTVCRPGA